MIADVIPHRSFKETESVFKVGSENGTVDGLSNHSDRKLRGGYYTPDSITEALAEWVALASPTRILEPSAGDGAFIQSLITKLSQSARITAIELSREEAVSAKRRGKGQFEVFCGDFFSWYEANSPDQYFDVVIGNPPFIRYQDFPERHREVSFALMREIGLNPNRLTNAWAPFVAVGARALREGGLLAMVLPAELLQVGYAAELRKFLAGEFSDLKIVTFREIVFPKIQQETIIVLGVKGRCRNSEVSFIELDDASALTIERLQRNSDHVNDLHHDKEKWLQYYLSNAELGLVREIEESGTFRPLDKYADVDVGIVTGRNQFFVLSEYQVERMELSQWAIPLVGRSFQIPGLTIYRDEWDKLAEGGHKCYLLQLGSLDRNELSSEALKYVQWGEDQGFHKGYKCRIRMPKWWNVPSVWTPDAFLLRQIHQGPRIISNGSGAVCTDTIHRIRTKGWVSGKDLAAVSMNSLTSAFAEIRGRSYGGGVLELEPSEAEALPIPAPTSTLDIDELDSLVRSGATLAAIDQIDRETLQSEGLSASDVETLRGIWKKMSERRIRRRKRRRTQ